jgi:hypothetical protein
MVKRQTVAVDSTTVCVLTNLPGDSAEGQTCIHSQSKGMTRVQFECTRHDTKYNRNATEWIASAQQIEKRAAKHNEYRVGTIQPEQGLDKRNFVVRGWGISWLGLGEG